VSKLLGCAKWFLRDEDGPIAVEHAVMLALIIVVCITAITTIGTDTNNRHPRVPGNPHQRHRGGDEPLTALA
jgi:pilus assembly protein Flp/PilA